jgi:hypothetical protein
VACVPPVGEVADLELLFEPLVEVKGRIFVVTMHHDTILNAQVESSVDSDGTRRTIWLPLLLRLLLLLLFLELLSLQRNVVPLEVRHVGKRVEFVMFCFWSSCERWVSGDVGGL